MIDIKVEPFNALPCVLNIFTINGIKASIDDFGTNEDTHPEMAEPYSCGYHRFIGYDLPSDDILIKYNISKEDFYEIVNKLEEVLDVGSCGWCS